RTGNNPDISYGLAQFYRRFVNVNYFATDNRLQDLCAQITVIEREIILKHVYSLLRNVQIENILEAALHAKQRLLTQNIVVDTPTHEDLFVSRFSFWSEGEVEKCELVVAF